MYEHDFEVYRLDHSLHDTEGQNSQGKKRFWKSNFFIWRWRNCKLNWYFRENIFTAEVRPILSVWWFCCSYYRKRSKVCDTLLELDLQVPTSSLYGYVASVCTLLLSMMYSNAFVGEFSLQLLYPGVKSTKFCADSETGFGTKKPMHTF